ncbi:MAG TPA: RDD family protein [Burkholderiales bacterium]|jgi:uncharacterized RDD family membrane protein YckC|nr:RDD family protein [Burkholderiales bacterium]
MFGFGKKKDKAEAPADFPMDTPAAPAAEAVELEPAGFWLRVVAFIVDYAVLLILLAAMMMGAMSVGGEELAGPAYLLWVLATFLYWPVLESTAWRGTVGKKLLGIVVGDIDGGGLSFVRSLLRNLAKIISSIPFGIGFLLAAFTSRKQALHDLITKAVVMRKGPGSFVRAIGVLVLGLLLLLAGGYLSFDHLMGSAMKDMEAMMGGGVAQPPARPQAKPPAKPPVVAKPAAPAPSAPAPTAAPAPGATPAPAAPAQQAPAQAQAPAAKPAPAPVQVAQAPAAAKPAAEPKPAPAPAMATTPAPQPAATAAAAPKPATTPAVKPAAAPAPATKPAASPAPVAKPAAAPVAKPVPAKEAAAPKAQETMEAKPEATPAAPRIPAEPLVPLARLTIPAQPGPRFNDIMTAVLYRDQATVSQLLALGRWPDKRDSNGLTPLMVAAGSGDAAMVRLLLERGANPNLQAPGGATALEFAQERGDAAATQLLQSKTPR